MTDIDIAAPRAAGTPWLSLVRAIARRKFLLIGVPFIVMALTAGATFLMPNRYTATLKIAPSGTAQLYLWALRNRGLEETVSRRLDLAKHYDVKTVDDAQRMLRKNVQFVSNLQDSYIDVQASDADPATATQIANAYGTGMVDLLLNLHLTDASNAIFELQSRRKLAQTSLDGANARLKQPDFERIANSISPSTRVGIQSTAGIEAELTLAGTNLKSPGVDQLLRQSLDPNELMSLQDRLSTLQRTLAQMERSKDRNPSTSDLSVISTLQDQAYWAAMVDRIDRRIAVLSATERNEIKLIPAEVPTDPVGPRRIMLTIAAGIAAFIVALAYVAVVEQVRRTASAS